MSRNLTFLNPESLNLKSRSLKLKAGESIAMKATAVKRSVCLFITLAVFCLQPVAASGVSPYLPEKLSPRLENEVQRLATIAGMPQLIRPYSLATIYSYMEKIQQSHPGLYSRLNLSLKPYARRFSLTHAKATASYSEEEHPIPDARGNTTDAFLRGSFRGQWQMADWFALYLGVDAAAYRSSEPEDPTAAAAVLGGHRRDPNVETAGSIVSMGLEWAQLDIGYRDIWLSPFQGSSQLLSTNAENFPSISLSNNLPIDIFGVGVNYQVFLAEMSRQPVRYRGEFSDEDPPLIAGFHLSIQPVPWWSLGATRIFQFAGGKRPLDFETLARAFVDPRGADNDASVDEESGNQIAAVSSRIHFDGRLPFSFALELAGEDTSNNKEVQLGNTALTAGWFFPYFFSENLSLAYEYSDWQDAWYTNNVYGLGYVNEGFVAGHWAMQIQRQLDTAVEGTSQYINVQWQTPADHIVAATLRMSEHNDSGAINYQQAWEAELEYTRPIAAHSVTFGLYAGEDALGADFSQLKISLEY